MLEDINKRIEAIDEAIEWLKQNRPEVFDAMYLQLVEERRKLKRLQVAEQDNPAVAAWGESQVGKSYLMGCLLQNGKTTFKVYENGLEYDFINDMNPIGRGTESTGVVTRFSHYGRNPDNWSEKHPVMMRAFSLTDIILVLSELYYNDLEDYKIPENIYAIAESIRQRYIVLPCRNDSILKADDMLELKSYYSKYINNAQTITNSGFFEMLALVVDRIPVSEYCSVFSNLWNNVPTINSLFIRLLNILQRLSFRRDFYLPVSAVLRKGNTILGVECLNGLFNDRESLQTNLFWRDEDNGFRTVENINKHELSALCAEVIFHISDDYVNSESEYQTDDWAEDTQLLMNEGKEKKKVSKDFLNKMDLLDFPGARSRGGHYVADLIDPSILCEVIIRGKVAYLFNKYSESRMLSVLLYCHHDEKTEVKPIPHILNKWVNTYVGATPEERAKNIATLDNVSPLFYVATKFNKDMELDPTASKNEPSEVAKRWEARFINILSKQCFDADSESVKWVKNWTSKGVHFQNSFLLRDFSYSGKLYFGFAENGEEDKRTLPDDFYRILRSTFCQPDAAHCRFFHNPALSWDAAATKNNDGSLYIIEHLSKVSDRILELRNSLFEKELEKSSLTVKSLLDGYYVKQTEEETLSENIKNAYAVFREMDFACTVDKSFFGHLIQMLQITEADLKDEIHRLTQFGEIHDIIHQPLDEYDIILQRVGDRFLSCKKEEDYWNVLTDVYKFAAVDEAKRYLNSKNVDFGKLIQKRFVKRIPSAIVAERIYQLWCRRIQSPDMVNKLTAGGFNIPVMTLLLKKLIDRSENLTQIMAEYVAQFTDLLDISKINENLVADILANLISEFVLNMGYEYLSQDKKENIRQIWKVYGLPTFNKVDCVNETTSIDLAAIFDRAVNNPNALAYSFEDNYNRWIEYMFIAFVADNSVKIFNKVENDKLYNIMQRLSEKE